MAKQGKTGNEPLAAAVNWQGLATFLGRGVDEVKTLELRDAGRLAFRQASTRPLPHLAHLKTIPINRVVRQRPRGRRESTRDAQADRGGIGPLVPGSRRSLTRNLSNSFRMLGGPDEGTPASKPFTVPGFDFEAEANVRIDDDELVRVWGATDTSSRPWAQPGPSSHRGHHQHVFVELLCIRVIQKVSASRMVPKKRSRTHAAFRS